MLGGERLGAGGKRQVELPNYGRSTHDLSHVWKNTNSIGTVVPCLGLVGLPGDSWDIGIATLVKTHPTIGPMFASYKMQIDVFQTPIGLYNANMYMNRQKLGMNMEQVKLPVYTLKGKLLDPSYSLDNQQVHSSCIFNYLGVRGIGRGESSTDEITRDFNAVDWLIYHDVIKNYYANKQEGVGYVIHNDLQQITTFPNTVEVFTLQDGELIPQNIANPNVNALLMNKDSEITITFNVTEEWQEIDPARFTFNAANQTMVGGSGSFWTQGTARLDELFSNIEYDEVGQKLRATGWRAKDQYMKFYFYTFDTENNGDNISPKLVGYDLQNIDRTRLRILQAVGTSAPVNIGAEEPFLFALNGERKKGYSATSNQEGLAVKTYQADQFNNWVATEWLEGSTGVNEISAIEVKDGKIYIEDINMASKVYSMLMNVAVSGGTVDDWQEANWGITRQNGITNPVFMGGMSAELTFDEVINTAGGDMALGTLAGRGNVGRSKGGKLSFKTTEISMITAYVSFTPRLDYSQGNEWHTDLKTMDDFHKPALDEIGFQDLITEKMAFWETYVNNNEGTITKYSAGKIPAWTDYMTNQNKTKGNFADMSQQGWMVNNRNYEHVKNGQAIRIKDLTTYVDPKKWNNQFADTRIDAQNIWTQIAWDIEVRRLMSAKVMPRTV